MHIGFDISQTASRKAGCGYFADAMIRAMLEIEPENQYSLYPSFGDFYFAPFLPFARTPRGKHARLGPRHIHRASARHFWNAPDLDASLNHPQVIHANNYWCPEQLISSRLFYTLYDLSFLAEPGWTTEENRLGCFEGVFRSAVRADWVVAISRFSRDQFLAAFPAFPPERVRVIYPCSRFRNSSAEGRRPPRLSAAVHAGKFWLNVGTLEPRKNQHRLAQAYANYLTQGGDPMPLVLAGGKGWLMEEFERSLSDLGIRANVIFTGYVSDDELTWLYRNCFANLYPSLFEGFGLPVLEGMQFGAATIASSATSIPEAAGDAALLLAPEDVDGWARAMLRLASDEGQRRRLAERGFAQARRFQWKDSASQLLALYREAIATPKRDQ